MRNYLLIICLLAFFGCSGADKKPGPDSINAIEDRPIEDTTIAPFPDGYAPPNADIDTSARVKDSIRRADSSNR